MAPCHTKAEDPSLILRRLPMHQASLPDSDCISFAVAGSRPFIIGGRRNTVAAFIWDAVIAEPRELTQANKLRCDLQALTPSAAACGYNIRSKSQVKYV